MVCNDSEYFPGWPPQNPALVATLKSPTQESDFGHG